MRFHKSAYRFVRKDYRFGESVILFGRKYEKKEENEAEMQILLNRVSIYNGVVSPTYMPVSETKPNGGKTMKIVQNCKLQEL